MSIDVDPLDEGDDDRHEPVYLKYCFDGARPSPSWPPHCVPLPKPSTPERHRGGASTRRSTGDGRTSCATEALPPGGSKAHRDIVIP